MKLEEMLKAVMEKAIEGGFDFYGCSKNPPEKLGAPYNENLVVVDESPPTFRWFSMVFEPEEPGSHAVEGTIGCVWEGDYYAYPPAKPCEQCGFQKEYPKGERASGGLQNWDIFKILLSHDFAKAFFGEERTCKQCGLKMTFSDNGRNWWCPSQFCDETMDEPAWEYHLQQAVLSDDPLEYYYSQISPNSKPKSL